MVIRCSQAGLVVREYGQRFDRMLIMTAQRGFEQSCVKVPNTAVKRVIKDAG